MMMKQTTLLLLALLMCSTRAFTSLTTSFSTSRTTDVASQLSMAQGDSDFMRWARQSRSAGAEDNVVQLVKPLGLVLNADQKGNVYVETVAPKGNAARTGKVKEGDIVTMCSATFGDEMWSCRGVGLTRVLAAIRVRAGPVRLVFETPKQYERKQKVTTQQIKAREEAEKAAQAKKDSLLKELERDEQKLKKGKFLGLF